MSEHNFTHRFIELNLAIGEVSKHFLHFCFFCVLEDSLLSKRFVAERI